MKWTITSTNSPREVAEEFAARAFIPPRYLDHGTLVIWGQGTSEVKATFKLFGFPDQIYELVGRPPGHWTVTSKFSVHKKTE